MKAGTLLILLGLLLRGDLLARQEQFLGERVVHLLDEPRHRPVRQEGQLTLLDVRIKPGDESLPHTHDQPILLTYISLADGPQNGRVRVNLNYSIEPLIHKVGNVGPGLFHIIALVHDGSGQPVSDDDVAVGTQVDPDIDNNWFRSYRYELEPGETTALQTHINPTFIIQGSEGLAHVSREDGLTRELAYPGAWAWRKAGSTYNIANVGDSLVAIIINEGRLQH
ncbi:MAG: hypothetical protein OXE78_11795 [Gammaproteobacteria bacterium]|nr:hypothetical protein [Gammaproteobacteria bacterium]MCY4357890.1 hypothetical protein [Gammaproteobacteria bacterium]